MLLGLLWSCIDPIDISVKDDGSRLVVFAEITTEAEPYYIDLSRTSNYDANNNPKVSGAIVSVVNSENDEFIFTEQKPGVYSSCPAEFVAEVGQTYQLKIHTADEKVYESEIETMRPTGTIDSLYYEVYDRPTMIGDVIRPEKGLRFFCDFKDNPEEEYCRVDWEGTYKFQASPYDTENTYCWNTEFSKFDINLYNDRYSNNSLNRNFEITFLKNGFRFKEDYSFKVKLKSMSEGGYRFWNLIKQQYENDGSIFAALPAQINSNIKCISDPNEKVLGYFFASAVAFQRIRISSYAIPGTVTSSLPCVKFRPTDPLQEYCYDCSKFENSVNEAPVYW